MNLFILIFIILILIFIIKNKNKLIIDVESFDSNIYSVNNLNDSTEAANILALLIYQLKILLEKIIKNHNINDKMDIKYIDYVKLIKKKLPYVKVSENPLDNNYTSYSINKGEELVFCIRDKKTKEFNNFNDILYVAIHEIAHIGCPEYGHTIIFNELNYYLLKKAIEYKIYNYVDYNKYNKSYCSTILSSTILNLI